MPKIVGALGSTKSCHDMVKIKIFLSLLFLVNIADALDDKNSSKENSAPQKPINLQPLYIPDSPIEVNGTIEDNQNQINQTDNVPKKEPDKNCSRPLIKPAEWLLESSFNNAPKLLRGIFTYLQSRSPKNKSSYSVTIPSFHRLILVGPPGSGKTTLAQAIAHKLGYGIVFVPATSLLGRYRNQTAKNIAHLLKEQAGQKVNIVIIIDELHKLFEHHAHEHSDDSQTATAFWLMLDEIETYYQNVIIIGTANNVDKLPPEIKSRFSGKIIFLPLATMQQTISAFKETVDNDKHIILHDSVDDAFIAQSLHKINNCSFRGVRFLIDTAKMFYYAEKTIDEEHVPIVLTRKHFEQALKQLKSESAFLQETSLDAMHKYLRKWGIFFSVAANIATFIQVSKPLLHIIQQHLTKIIYT